MRARITAAMPAMHCPSRMRASRQDHAGVLRGGRRASGHAPTAPLHPRFAPMKNKANKCIQKNKYIYIYI